MATPQRTARIEDEIWDPAQEKAQAEGSSLAQLMRSAVERYLAGVLLVSGDPASQDGPVLTSQAGPASQVTNEVPPGGISSPGVVCMWAACGNRDTRRYGVTDPAELERTDYRERARDENAVGHTLCPAHAARLGGLIYRRPVVPLRAGSAA